MTAEEQIDAMKDRIMQIMVECREWPDPEWPAPIKFQQEINALQDQIDKLRGGPPPLAGAALVKQTVSAERKDRKARARSEVDRRKLDRWQRTFGS